MLLILNNSLCLKLTVFLPGLRKILNVQKQNAMHSVVNNCSENTPRLGRREQKNGTTLREERRKGEIIGISERQIKPLQR